MFLRPADRDATPPTASNFWAVPGCLLADTCPGDSDHENHEAHRTKVQALIDAGIRTSVNLMERKQQHRERHPRISSESPERLRFAKGWLAWLQRRSLESFRVPEIYGGDLLREQRSRLSREHPQS